MKRVVPLLLALAFSMGAQVRFDAPKLGYVYDSEAKSIRQLGGVPGSAVFDANNIDAGGAVERAWISSRGFAVVQGKQDAGSRLVDFTRGSSRTLPDVEMAAISNSGRYYATLQASGAVEIWDGDAESRSAKFQVAAGAGRGLAVSDDGGAVLIATADALILWQDGRGMSTIWGGESITGASFLGESQDFAALDAGRNIVLTSRAGAVSESDAPVSGAISVSALRQGSKLIFGATRSIVILDLASGATQSLDLDAAVEGFSRVGRSDDVLQIRFRDDQRTALLELGDRNSPQVEYLVLGGGVR